MPPAPTSILPVKQVKNLAKAVQFMLVGMALLALVTVFVEARVASELRAIVDGAQLTQSTERLVDVSDYLSLAFLVGLLATGITTIVMMKRMADNGALMRPGLVEHKTHWAITGWFVPFLNLWRPFQMMDQIWQTSRPASQTRGQEIPSVARFWWGSFVIFNVASRVTPSAPWEGATLSQYAAESQGIAIVSGIEVVSAILFLLTVRAIAAQHEAALADPAVPTAHANRFHAPPPVGVWTVPQAPPAPESSNPSSPGFGY